MRVYAVEEPPVAAVEEGGRCGHSGGGVGETCLPMPTTGRTRVCAVVADSRGMVEDVGCGCGARFRERARQGPSPRQARPLRVLPPALSCLSSSSSPTLLSFAPSPRPRLHRRPRRPPPRPRAPHLQMNGLASEPKLPPLPPPSDYDNADFTPHPPPKPGPNLPPINTAGSLNVPELGTSSSSDPPPAHRVLTRPCPDSMQPMTPITPTSLQPPRSPAADGKPKKVNPLTDLVETEKVYVDLLTGVIRVRLLLLAFGFMTPSEALIISSINVAQKVAAAWSRSNLPPPELDSMFRAVEGVYRANRSLLSVSLPPYVKWAYF